MPHRFLGPPVVALELDFLRLPVPAPGSKTLVTGPELASTTVDLPCDASGEASAIAWWFDVCLAQLDGEALELPAGPGSAQRTWKQNCRFLEDPLKVRPGVVLEIGC